MQLTPENILLHIALIDGLGPAVVKRLLACLLPDQLPLLYEFGISDLMHRCQLPENIAKRLYDGLQNMAAFERELQLLKDHNLVWMSLLHPNFPPLLKEIHLPPIGLYIRGKIPATMSCLAVVGSRAANLYGQHVVDRLIPELCAQGIVIVSGGAYGIDMMAHSAAVAARCPTIAVMGSGLLQISRDDNVKLFPRIVQTGGAIVSPFPLTMDALPGHFPARNRIIAGLSQGCLVVQAAKKSGALITATFTLEQGREVFAVPGAIDDELSAGCHNLLREGATLVETAADITGVVPIFTSKPMQMTIGAQDELIKDVSIKIQEKQGTGNLVDDSLVALCAKPVSVDDLASKLQLDLFDVQTRLFELQMAGRVQQNFMGLWHI